MDRKSLGQYLATASVVLSLLLVAYQIRQNTIVTRVQAYQTFTAESGSFLSMQATDPIVAPLMVRVYDDAALEEFEDPAMQRGERERLDVANALPCLGAQISALNVVSDDDLPISQSVLL